MILVPHQDDEVLMTAGIIHQAVKRGIRVDAVMVTNGDYEGSDYAVGRIRLRESLSALALLGLPKEQFHILGYADTGMPESESFLTKLFAGQDEERVYPSHCSQETYSLEELPEYHWKCFGEHGKYNRKTLKGDLKGILQELRPDVVFTTSEYDTHGDHSGLYHFLMEILDECREKAGIPTVYTSIVHSCAGDEYWPDRASLHFTCPCGLEEKTGLKWEERICVPLPEEMQCDKKEDNLKLQALKKYEFALEPGAVSFLMSFIKDEEIFWKVIG